MADNEVKTNLEPDEEYSPINVNDLEKERVKLGRQGENLTQKVQIDCNEWLVELQGCTFMVVAMRPGERELYVPDVTVSAGMITWPITAQDTACAGAGRAEVRALKGDQVKKSKLFRTWIEPALDGNINGTPTTPPNWVKETKDALDNANALMSDALEAANTANTAAENLGSEVEAAKTDALDAIAAAKGDAADAAEASIEAIGEARDVAAEAIQAAREAAVADAGEAMDDLKTEAVAAGVAALEDAKDAKVEEITAIKTNAEQVAASAVTIAQGANTLATQALEAATTAENDVAEVVVKSETNETNIQTLQLQILDRINGGFVDNGIGYFTADGRVIFEMTGMGGGGSGGGGGDSGNNASIKMENTSGWMSKTITALDDSCPVSFRWTSLENDLPTGNGSLTVRVSGTTKTVMEVPQGDVTINVAPYLVSGSNIVSLTVSDIYNNNRTINVTVTVVELTLASSFDASTPYTSAISFPYTPTGQVQKTVHFILDGVELGTVVTSVSGRQQSYTILQQSHGAHTLDVYFEATVNGQEVRSNQLHYEIICIDPLSTEPIIVSNFAQATAQQYETLNIDYNIYDPTSLEAAVVISVNGVVATRGTVDRTTQTFSTRCDVPGAMAIEIKTGDVVKTFNLTVTESEIDIKPVTDKLALHLSAAGRSNTEADRDVWEYGSGAGKVAATFTGFNWSSDGWQIDDDGQTCLRVQSGARVEIPYKPYATDFVQDGKTIEIEFKAHDVMDYEAVLVSCMDSERGLQIKADNAKFASTRGNIDTRFSVDTHMRLTLAVMPRTPLPLMYLYIDGEYQGIVKYTAGSGSFAQPTPVGITIGSDDCAVDVYSIRVYDRCLTMDEVLENYIADRQDVGEMLKLYNENNIKNASGQIDINLVKNALPNLPYFICEGPESPQYKGDKKTVVFDLYDTASNVERILHDSGVSINVQGTSSQYYAVKNWKIKLSNGATLNGVAVAGFTIRGGEIMVNEFTLKADVASSESANNIVLEKLFNDLSKQLGILTPPQQKNSAVRVGVDGFPSVNFWDYGDGPEFVGKYNFNNDKGTFDTFGFTEGDQAWDVRSNTSQLSKFHTADFPDNWYTEDYESIYPEDYSGDELMKPMHEWMYSTWQEKATGAALPQAATYEGVTYTNDTAAYRLAKFKAEFGDWWDIDNQTFYYCFTEFFLMVDSRQKNEHIVYWHELGKWWDLIWDCDAALGNDNRGNLTFEYWMEDTDKVGNEAVFNGFDNVKWENFRQAFPDRIAAMYQRMISSGMLAPAYLIKYFADWQAAWCKAIWNEDGYYKYVRPLEVDGDDQYLSMAYGSKLWQRNDFIPWRYRYICSKYNVGAAMSTIMFRPYYEVTEAQRAAGDVDITVDLYKKSYVTAVWDSTLTGRRMIGDALTMQVENPLAFANDAVCAVRNAEMVKAVHGLEKLYVGYWDSAAATNLQEVVLGSDATGYQNTATKTVAVGANAKLKKVDLRNCVSFGTDSQKTLTLTQCPNIQEVYLTGTQAYGVELPNGGVLNTLALPATTQSIILRNHPKLTDAGLTVDGYSNVNQLWLENMTGLDTLALLKKVPANTAVRVTGFYWECANAAAIEAVLELFDTMRGIDIDGRGQGVEVDIAQVSGTLHTSALTGSQIAQWRQKFPNYSSVAIIADHTETTLTVKTWDGGETVKAITCIDGVAQEALPSVPARTSTAQYDYTAVGWNREMDASTAQSDAGLNVIEDRTIYAAYSRKVRSYTITWKNDDGTTLDTETYQYGATPSYKKGTPTSGQGSGNPFQGWTPTIATVTGNATYTASYIPTYTATFVRASEDGGGTLYTQTNVQQGTTPTYGGETPTSTREGYKFKGWTPALSGMTANTTYTAVFEANGTVWTDPSFDVANTYAAQWDYSQNKTGLARGGLAASLADPVPATDLTGTGSSPFDSIEPWASMKRYNVIDGSLVPDTDASFNETDNDTVVYIPEFYYKVEKNTDSKRWTWAISPTAKTGYEKHPGSGVYVGRFHTSGSSSAVYTKGGVNPLVSTTRANFRTYSKAKGDGWHQIDLATWSAIQLLYLVEFANWHSQDQLGTGQNTGSVKATGATTGAAYHTIKRNGASNAYRWIENPFSNVLTWVDGFVANNRAAYVSTDMDSYGESTTGMEATGITLPSSEMITGLGYSDKCPWAFIPDTASGGGASTYVTDRVVSNTGVRLVAVGGNYYSNANYGMFYFNAFWDVTETDGILGSRLLYKKP